MVHKEPGEGITHAVIYLGVSANARHMGIEWYLHDQRWRATYWSDKYWKQMLASGDYEFPCNVDKVVRGCTAVPKPPGYIEPVTPHHGGYE
jgi:hypothetical protein